jgi:two-component system OmpR family response regulator
MWELETEAGPHVLIVDDSVDLCELITELLSLSGYVTAIAGDGATALRLLRDGLRPRMILLDRSVPVLDGLGFLENADGLLQGISIVWMTGDDAEVEHPAVAGTLRKPFELDDLLRVVRLHAGDGEPAGRSTLS